MKIDKLIVFIGIVSFSLLSGCVSEDLGKDCVLTERASFDLLISSNMTETKAQASIPASEDEGTINTALIVVFNKDGNNIGEVYSRELISDMSSKREGNTNLYKITGLNAQPGNIRILMIANSAVDYSSCNSWESFMSQIENTSSFVANNLPKIGYKDITLAQVGNSNINIELSQLAARIDLKIKVPSNDISFTLSEVRTEIHTRTNIDLSNINQQKDGYVSTVFTSSNGLLSDSLSFYTYEYDNSKKMTLNIKGRFTEPNTSPRDTSFTVLLDNHNVEHGNNYHIIGTLDPVTRKLNFNWTILPWSDHLREVYVDVIKSAYLVVKDLSMTMPNCEAASTTFQSSSKVTITNKTVMNGSNYSNLIYSVTAPNTNNGSINITSTLPVNFVPKYITFTVKNEEGLTQNVSVVQYPPLYITSTLSLTDADAGQGQTNSNMYMFKSLVADFSQFPMPDEKDYNRSTWSDGISFCNFIRNNGVLGYPTLVDKVFNKDVSSSTNGSSGSRRVNNVNVTAQTVTNNYMISPNFVLASQNGTNSNKTSVTHEEFCAGYIEQSRDNITFPENTVGKWRVPTKAELYLIDILQNVKACDVKRILEGGNYWCATPEQINFIDNRVSGTDAVRCVRDIK